MQARGAAPIFDECAFSVLDRDCDGQLGVSDLEKALQATNADVKPEILQQLAGNGLTREEFCKVLEVHQDSISAKDTQTLAFNLCDGQAAGLVGPSELRKGLGLLGMEATEDEAKELIREYDYDGDGKLSRTEFLVLMGA
mmetsp:Transcript_112069/g.222757  ORF Transcript_112069/g.222757 Transcript_112069/m.222757 type:complete len:140 (+) Transcript_112069:105-524(+)